MNDRPLSSIILEKPVTCDSKNGQDCEQARQKCGQSGQGQNGHFHFRIRSFAHYNINITIYIIVADFDI